MQNGYAFVTNSKALAEVTRAIEAKSDEELASLANQLKVGVLRDTQVTCRNWGTELLSKPEQLVTQVFCSAFPISYNIRKLPCFDVDDFRAVASAILDATYEATFLSASLTALRHNFQYGSKKLYLTCVGGAAFGNRLDWIASAIRRCVQLFENYNLEVSIVVFSKTIPPELLEFSKA